MLEFSIGDTIVFKIEGEAVRSYLVTHPFCELILDIGTASVEWESDSGAHPDGVPPGTTLYFEGDVPYRDGSYTLQVSPGAVIRYFTSSDWVFDTLDTDPLYTPGSPFDSITLSTVGPYTVDLLWGSDLLASDVINVVPLWPGGLGAAGVGLMLVSAVARRAGR